MYKVKSFIYFTTAGLMWFAVFVRFASAQLPSNIYGETPPTVGSHLPKKSIPSREPAGLKLQTFIASQLHKDLPPIKDLDLSFACKTSQVRTADQCYHYGIVELYKLGCVLSGAVSSQNCGLLTESLNEQTGEKILSSDWVCSVPSSNCKEIDEARRYDCPLHYRKANVRDHDVLGNGRVMVDFLFYCIADSVNGRKQEHVILPNAPMTP